MALAERHIKFEKHRILSQHSIPMGMATGSHANPSLVTHRGDETFQRSEDIDENDYPFGLPSFSPFITDIKGIQSILNDRDYFGKTRCEIFEASALDFRWLHDVDDEGLKNYLHDHMSKGNTKLAFRSL